MTHLHIIATGVCAEMCWIDDCSGGVGRCERMWAMDAMNSHGGRECAAMVGNGGQWWAVHAVLGYMVWYLGAWCAWMIVVNCGSLWVTVGYCGWVWLVNPLSEYGEWVQPATPSS